MDIFGIYKSLTKFSKEKLIWIIVILVIFLMGSYPLYNKMSSIEKKIDHNTFVLDTINLVYRWNTKQLERDLIDTMKRCINASNIEMEKRIINKMDEAYQTGFHIMINMNNDLHSALIKVDRGQQSLLEALKEIDTKQEERLKEYMYMDSLRRRFYNKVFNIEVKPIKMAKK